MSGKIHYYNFPLQQPSLIILNLNIFELLQLLVKFILKAFELQQPSLIKLILKSFNCSHRFWCKIFKHFWNATTVSDKIHFDNLKFSANEFDKNFFWKFMNCSNRVWWDSLSRFFKITSTGLNCILHIYKLNARSSLT